MYLYVLYIETLRVYSYSSEFVTNEVFSWNCAFPSCNLLQVSYCGNIGFCCPGLNIKTLAGYPGWNVLSPKFIPVSPIFFAKGFEYFSSGLPAATQEETKAIDKSFKHVPSTEESLKVLGSLRNLQRNFHNKIREKKGLWKGRYAIIYEQNVPIHAESV